MKKYLDHSHSAFYSVVLAIPLLLLYEVLLALTSTPYVQVRNAAEMWLRNVLLFLNINSQQATFFMIGILLASIPFIKTENLNLHGKYIVYMLFEALIYSFLLGVVIQFILNPVFLLLPNRNPNSIQLFALSLGAGLYEEFFFRVIMLNGIFFFFGFLIKNVVVNGIISVLLASFMFSASHYVGNMADSFNIYSFIFRFAAGLLFTILYLLRGFGITAYTHAFYDIRILV